MKKLLFLLVAAATLFATSCKDDESNPEYIRASIDGAAFDASNIIGSVTNSFGEDLLFVNGRNSDGSFSIGFGIPTSTPVGNIAIDENDLGILFSDDSNNGFFTVGNINLTKNDASAKVLEGEFSFTATQDDDDTVIYQITGGEFRLNY